MKLSFQGSQGQVIFFFGNKSSDSLERVICVVPPSPQFSFQLGPVPSLLQPKQQVQVSRLQWHLFVTHAVAAAVILSHSAYACISLLTSSEELCHVRTF